MLCEANLCSSTLLESFYFPGENWAVVFTQDFVVDFCLDIF
jgi:hypothetical protein